MIIFKWNKLICCGGSGDGAGSGGNAGTDDNDDDGYADDFSGGNPADASAESEAGFDRSASGDPTSDGFNATPEGLQNGLTGLMDRAVAEHNKTNVDAIKDAMGWRGFYGYNSNINSKKAKSVDPVVTMALTNVFGQVAHPEVFGTLASVVSTVMGVPAGFASKASDAPGVADGVQSGDDGVHEEQIQFVADNGGITPEQARDVLVEVAKIQASTAAKPTGLLQNSGQASQQGILSQSPPTVKTNVYDQLRRRNNV